MITMRKITFMFLICALLFITASAQAPSGYFSGVNLKSQAAQQDQTAAISGHPSIKDRTANNKNSSTGFMPDLSLLDQHLKKELTGLQKKQVEERIASLPISFRKNMGQWNNEIIYRGSSPGWHANINFLKDGLSFGFLREQEEKHNEKDLKQVQAGTEEKECMVWNLKFKGANANPIIIAEGKEDSRTNYLLNADIDKQQLNVPDYRMIRYNELFNNIDLRYYSSGKKLKYDYVIHSGGDISQIQMACEGIEKLTINEPGQLEITTQWGTLVEELPESYQIVNGKKKLVKIDYKLIDKTTFGFAAKEHYNSSIPLVIDPVNLAYCTMIGSDAGNGYIADIAIDAGGNLYGVSDEGGGSYPTTPGVYSNNVPFPAGGPGSWGYNVYVFKLNPAGTALVWATFLSTGRQNNTSDEKAIAIDATGNVYIAGGTCPSCGGGGGVLITTPGAYDTSYNGPPAGSGNAYALKLNSTGTSLLYSTYLGSTAAAEHALDIAVSTSGLMYVTGFTKGATYPVTPGAYDTSYNGGEDIFLSVLNPAGAGAADLVYSTFIGGSGNEDGICLAVDGSNKVYISGGTSSGNFPATAGAYDNTFNGTSDVFVCKLDPSGAGAADMIYSTFIGGPNFERGNGITVNSIGEAFVVGDAPAGFPVTAGAYDVTFGTSAIFALKLNASGNSLLYSTYIDDLRSAKVALSQSSCDNDEIFISAIAGASPPITSCAYISTAPASPDIIILKLKTAGAGAADLLYSTYFGGNANDYNGPITAIPICANAAQEVFVGYTSHSTNTPTTPGAYITSHTSGSDQPVVLKLKPTVPALNFTSSVGACNNTISFTGTAGGTCIWQSAWSPSYWQWNFGDGQTSNLQNPTHVYASAGTYNVKLIVGCPKDSTTKIITITPTVTFTTSVTNPGCGSNNGSATASPTGGSVPFVYSWSNGQTAQTATGLAAGSYTVKTTDNNGCSSQQIVLVSGSGTLTANVIGTNASCTVLGNAIANISGGSPSYIYNWSNGQAAQTATNLSAGIYTVTVTDASGCAIVKSVTITQPTAVTATITATTQATCGANNGSATVTGANGTGLYTYNWNNGQTTQIATNLAAGNYTVTVKDGNGCSSTQKAVITTIPPSSFTLTSTNGTCGNNGNASITASGGTGPYIYSWSGTSQTGATAILPTGSYTAMVTDGNGCTSTNTFAITNTPALASATFTQSPSGTVCVGALVNFTNTGSTGSATHNWLISTITPANISGTTTDFSYTFLTAGSYTVQHSVTFSGCSTSISSTVTVSTCAGGPNVTATSSTVCPGSCTAVTSSGTGGSGNYTYSWSTGETTQNINPCPASTTTYTVKITDAGGNTGTATATVTVNPAITVTATAILNCGTNSGNVTAAVTGGSSSFTYSWSNGVTTITSSTASQISNLTSNTYSITVTDSKGCTASSSAIIDPPFSAQYIKGTAACAGCGCKEWIMVTPFNGRAPYSYSWPGGYDKRYLNRLCPGSYTINVTDKNGCTADVVVSTP
jgi:PKD repeat protein